MPQQIATFKLNFEEEDVFEMNLMDDNSNEDLVEITNVVIPETPVDDETQSLTQSQTQQEQGNLLFVKYLYRTASRYIL